MKKAEKNENHKKYNLKIRKKCAKINAAKN